MKQTIFLIAAAFFISACGSSATPVGQAPENAAPQQQDQGRLETVTSHSVDRSERPPVATAPGSTSDGKSSWSRGGEPIDTTKFDSEIASAKKALDAEPNSQAAKQALSRAYTVRGNALTKARQYAAALGDYRKAYKLDPSNTEAKQWVDQIIVIYEGLNKDYPKEGEEPEPLPFKGGSV